MKAKLLIAGALALGVLNAPGNGLDQQSAVRAIIGEGASEPLQAQVAIACVIRNRGSLKGVYGASNPVVNKASKAVLARAALAWQMSATNDVTHGLKYFGCKSDTAYFKSLGLHPAMKIGAITFWK